MASSRSQDENFIYEASFQPINAESFWLGHVRKFNIENDGNVGSVVWDAGAVLKTTSAASRTIKTLKAGALTSFDTTNIVKADLGVTTDQENLDIIGFVRGESAYNKEGWKLGDIFRSAPVTVGTPSAYFKDSRDGANAFAAHRTSNARTSANGKRAIVAGANDGQLHAFRTDIRRGRAAGASSRRTCAPSSRTSPTRRTRRGFRTSTSSTGPSVSPTCGWERATARQSRPATGRRSWSSARGAARRVTSGAPRRRATRISTTTIPATRPYYCGFWALDVTNTASPVYKWKITPTTAQSPYLGDPWSKMYIHRVKINGNEKWVGFMGAGHNLSNVTICAGDPAAEETATSAARASSRSISPTATSCGRPRT